MKVVIRTDASIEIGAGHVMRCLTLAKQLRNVGATVTFVCRNILGNSIAHIEKEGFTVTPLPFEVEKGTSEWLRDAEETQAILMRLSRKIDVLIVDHYGLDIRWETKMRAFVANIMVIDDLANRRHDCDLLLDQNYYIDMHLRYANLLPDTCIQLLGPSYVLLRDEFLNIDTSQVQRTGEINTILIFYGGSDPTGETLKALIAIRDLDVEEINVVVGAANPRKDQVEQLCNELSNAHYYCQINNMAQMMQEADLAIGAGGATTWERCYLGLPSLVTIVAPNQLKLTTDMEITGALINLGYYDEVTGSQITQTLLRLLEQPQEMTAMITKCSAIVNIVSIKRNPVLTKLVELSR